MRSAGIAVVVMLVLAGCSKLPPPAGIQLTVPATADVAALPVTVVDHAGIVRAATPGQRPNDLTGATGVEAVPGRDDAVLLTWLGGECDDRAIVTIDAVGRRYRVSVESPSSALSCSAVGFIRTIMLELTEPIEPDEFEMAGS